MYSYTKPSSPTKVVTVAFWGISLGESSLPAAKAETDKLMARIKANIKAPNFFTSIPPCNKNKVSHCVIVLKGGEKAAASAAQE